MDPITYKKVIIIYTLVHVAYQINNSDSQLKVFNS